MQGVGKRRPNRASCGTLVGELPEYRYKAFISYSHTDKRWAQWLHEALETYRPPKNLELTERLQPIFRDTEELAAAGNLSESILSALTESEFLIVICSTAAAGSRWVNAEIEAFLQQATIDRVLCLIIDGRPNDIDMQCFPDALKLESGHEPVGADVRQHADGKRKAKLKIAAGLLKVPFDALAQRDWQRRKRRITLNTTATVALILAATVGFYLVQSAGLEADTRRQQAASFVSLCVDSLEERIVRYEKVGELDADLAQALEFFATLTPQEMDPQTLEGYRTAMLGIGTVRLRQGKPESALKAFYRARDLSQSMVDREGDEASRWYDLATHTYYIGEALWEMQHIPEAAEFIVESLQYAERASALAPDVLEYQLEVVFGLTNVGAVNTRLKRYDQAVAALQRSLQKVNALYGPHADQRLSLLEQEVEAVSWLAEIEQTRSRYEAAFKWHDHEISLHRQLLEANDNPKHLGRLSDALGHYAQSLSAVGDTQRALTVLQNKVVVSAELIALDPENAFFQERLFIGQAMLAVVLFDSGDAESAGAMLNEAEQGMREMIDNDMQANSMRRDLSYVGANRAYLLLHADTKQAFIVAETTINNTLANLDRENVDAVTLAYFVRCVAVYAAAERLLGQPPADLIRDALTLLQSHGSKDSVTDIAYEVLLLHALDRHDEAELLEKRLQLSGFRSVYFETLFDVLQHSNVGAASPHP